MRIERVDDKTVKCYITNEELEEFDIDYKDFILRSEKAKEVVQEIIEQAEQEVGYRPPKFAFDLQIMMLPNEGLVLTFSEKEPADFKEGEQMMECLRDMKEILQQARAAAQTQTGNSNPKSSVPNTTSAPDAKSDKPVAEEKTRPEEAVFVFDRITSLMEYASILPATLRVHSALYTMNNLYYLHMQKGNASYKRYSRACVQAMEFASLYAVDGGKLLHLQEHGECLIPNQAIKKLRG